MPETETDSTRRPRRLDPESTLPKIGDTYRGMRIEAELGSGAFARVFRVAHPGHTEPMALKLSKVPLTDEALALRALREVQILQKMTNDHVVRIFDYGLGPDERWFMVLELLVGQELGAHHDFDLPMDPARASGIVHEAAMGLDEAHALGIVHRDVKPDNLWIRPDGHIKVIDFGLARAFDKKNTIGSSATVGHMLIGTPHYAQPEQLQDGKLTPASDVYSLGVILYELLTGRTPLFEDQPVSVIREALRPNPLQWVLAHAQRPVIPLERYVEGRRLPRELIALVEQSLLKDPSRRPPRGGALANRLGRVLHHHFGAALAATLIIDAAGLPPREETVLPGRHRIGHSVRCEIRLGRDSSKGLSAVLEWTGKPRYAEIRPLRAHAVQVNGHSIERRTAMRPGDVAVVDSFRLRLSYPA